MTTAKRSDICHVFSLREVARRALRLYEGYLAAEQLTMGQFAMLDALGGGALAVPQITEILGTERTTFLRGVTPLRKSGLVTVTRAPEDSRQFLYALTEAGRAKLSRAIPLWEAAQKEYEALVQPDAAGRLRTALQGVSAKLGG